METTKEKQAKLANTLRSLEKKYGKGVVMNLNKMQVTGVPCISTGSIKLDNALGIGGLPCGRIVEIYGPEASGKTTLALHCMAEVGKQGGKAVLVDSEHAFDREYAQQLGVDMKNLLVAQPDDGQQALEITSELIASGGVQLVVIDSVAALVPRSELDGEIGEQKVGAQARLMSQALRKLVGLTHRSGAICLFINQIRHKIGVFFGSPETTSGGNALKFYASIRLDIRKIGLLKQGAEQVIGHRVRVKVVKNKLAPPFRTAEFDLIYGKGISKVGELLDLGVSLGIIKQAGAWFSYGEMKLGKGRENVQTHLVAHPDLQNKLLAQIKKCLHEEREAKK